MLKRNMAGINSWLATHFRIGRKIAGINNIPTTRLHRIKTPSLGVGLTGQ